MTTNLSSSCYKAINEIHGFPELLKLLKEGTLIRSLSESTYYNYSRKLADICLYFKKLPDNLSEQEINQYLATTISNARNYSKSEFKHLVFGLRLYFKIINRPNMLRLPEVKNNQTLPRVLNQKECVQLIKSIPFLKQRLVVQMIYGAGLRFGELRNLQWIHLDVERMLVHVRQGKGGRDRYIPLSKSLLPDLLCYIQQEPAGNYVFHGTTGYPQISAESIRHALRKAAKKAGIDKQRVSIHMLRHSYATHLLEQGVDIITIKELMGHSKIETTAMYLQITQTRPSQKISPLDNIMPLPASINATHIQQRITELRTKFIRERDNDHNQLKLFED